MTEQRPAALDRGKGTLTGRPVRRAGATAALMLVALLGACADNPEPEPLDETTSAADATPSPSARPSPTGAPTLPPEARGTSRKAAIAFVEYWVDVLNFAMSSGTTER